MILNYNMDFRCSLYFLYFMYSTFQRASVVWLVAMGLPEHWGVGPIFHNFNESKQPWPVYRYRYITITIISIKMG